MQVVFLHSINTYMKTEKNFIDYGIYVDHKQSYIITLSHVVHEQFLEEYTEEFKGTYNLGDSDETRQVHIQNHKNEQLKKFCKAIVAQIVTPHHILVFGPSGTKFELQKEIKETKQLHGVAEELLVTDVMDKDAAVRFVTNHYTTIQVGQQAFTAPKIS